MESASELTQLANLITSSLAILQEEWRKEGIPEPSLDPFSPDSTDFMSLEADKAYRTILGATKALSVRVAGPLRWAAWQFQGVRPVNI